MLDIFGKLIKTIGVSVSKELLFDLTTLSKGIYMIELTDENGNVSMNKFVLK